MRVTFLGTGTSYGIPQIGCDCAVCRSDDPHDKRLRPSVLVSDGGANVLVDASPDFRAQALRANIRRVHAVLLTHPHADHILGLDELRVFTEQNDAKIPLYGSAETMADIQRVFPYACTEKPAWAGLPRFSLNPVEPDAEFRVATLPVRSLALTHARITVFGYQFGRQLAYLTDCSVVPDLAIERIRGVTLLVLDALRHRPHPAHLTLTRLPLLEGGGDVSG